MINLLFGGFQKSSLIEYPGAISAVVFTIGCNFRCPFCHNYRLVLPELYPKNTFSEDSILKYLKTKKGIIDAVSITGGEPTLHKEQLIAFMQKVKNLGFLVQLETNGTNPDIINRVISEKLVDYIAMDIKTRFERYTELGVTNLEAVKNIKETREEEMVSFEDYLKNENKH